MNEPRTVNTLSPSQYFLLKMDLFFIKRRLEIIKRSKVEFLEQ